jgi:hypothetical protein
MTAETGQGRNVTILGPTLSKWNDGGNRPGRNVTILGLTLSSQKQHHERIEQLLERIAKALEQKDIRQAGK